MSFGDEIASWASSAQNDILEECAEKTKQLFSDVVRFSPVDTGRFVANWHVGSGIPNYSVSAGQSREAKISEIKRVVHPDYFLLNTKAVLINNLDYSRQVEYEGWANTNAYAPVAKAIAKNLI